MGGAFMSIFGCCLCFIFPKIPLAYIVHWEAIQRFAFNFYILYYTRSSNTASATCSTESGCEQFHILYILHYNYYMT